MRNNQNSQELTIQQAISRAKKATKQGKIADAVELYNAVLQHQPNHPIAKKRLRELQKELPPTPSMKEKMSSPPQDEIDALVNLYHSGQMAEAEQACKELLNTYPQTLVAINVLGATLEGQGKLQEAVQAYNKAIQLNPDYAVAHYNLGNTLQELGRSKDAEASYGKAIALKSDFAEAHSNLGITLQELGRSKDAEASFRKAIALKSDYAEAHYNLGNTLQELVRLKDAEASYRKAIALKPDYPKAHSNLGNTLRDSGRLEDAEASYRKAIALKADYAEAYSNLGNTLKELGRSKDAEASYRKAIALKPDYAEAHYNRGKALKDLWQLDEAVASYDKAIQLKPDLTEAFNNRGTTLVALGRLNESIQNYDKAIQLKPDYAEAYSNLLMSLNYTLDLNVIDYIATARKFGKIVTEKAQIHFSAYKCLPMPERLRVGFVSSDLRNHPVGHFLESILSSIDSSKIELIAYPTTPTVDDLSERIKPSFSIWKPIYGKNDEAAANMIYADGVHVLLDLSGHTADNRLPIFGYKPSPVQVSWLGYFATTGLNEMDYLIGDPYVTPPEDDDHFTEKVWRLPETRWCFTPPNADVEVSVPPAVNNGYVTFGCFNNIAKVNDKVVALWTKVLEAVPNSRLLLKANQFRDQMARENIIQRFAAHGIDSKRISLEESEDRQKYFAAYNKIDITLDPFPFTGGTTSVESLWMGVPLVTLEGGSLISRQGVGVLMNAGLPDWIAEDEEEYVAKAVLFASDLDKLAILRTGLRSQVLASPLFDAPRFARNIENALWAMWNQTVLSGVVMYDAFS